MGCFIKDDDAQHVSPHMKQLEMEFHEEHPQQPGPGMDEVNHPSHYTTGDIEVIDYLRDKLTKEEFIGYCTGNVMKYVSRWRHKGGTEDLRKAAVYQRWGIERAESD